MNTTQCLPTLTDNNNNNNKDITDNHSNNNNNNKQNLLSISLISKIKNNFIKRIRLLDTL